MRVGMVVDGFLPQIGGAEIHVLELSRALRNLGAEVRICTATPGPERVDGFETVRFPLLEGGGGRRAVRSMPVWIPLLRFVRSVEILHCHYTFLMSALSMPMARLLRKPTVVTLHGLGTLDSSVGRSLARRTYRLASFRMADRVIATSQEMADVARRFVPESRIVVLPNGVDTDFFVPQHHPSNASKEHFVILAMRRLAPKNGIQYLIESAPLVLRKVPNARFWISGKGKLEPHIRKRVQELGLEKYVLFLGEVPHDQTRDYYAQADLVVFPSSAESTSLACLEAMSMEKPIVASALSAYREMLGDNERGVLVPLFDRESSDYNAPLTLPPDRLDRLANAIVQLAKDPRRRELLGRRARAFVQAHYSWNRIATQTWEIYQELVGRKG